MSPQQILEAAIRKAVKNGWVPKFLKMGDDADKQRYVLNVTERNLNEILFDHDFARAFWGDGMIHDDDLRKIPSYLYHLQQLALSEDRLAYIKKFLDQPTEHAA